MKTLLKLQKAKKFLIEQLTLKPEIAVVLGSGLNEISNIIKPTHIFHYNEIPFFPKPTIKGHEGKLIIGKYDSKNILFMCGRVHFYEGYPLEEVTFPIRLMALLGVKILILTSAVGGINPNYKPADIVSITDHINFMGDNPLRGQHDETFGRRFPDMTHIYSKKLLKLAKEIAKENKITLHDGTYIAVRGPSYETPAEIKAFRKLGADVVGMSVVPEAIVAHQMGMEVLCFAFVSNLAAGISKKELSHEEVIETARKSLNKLKQLISGVIKKL